MKMLAEDIKAIRDGMVKAMELFYLGVSAELNRIVGESDEIRAERTRIGLKGYIMALMDQGNVAVNDVNGAIRIGAVPLEALTLLPLVFGKEKMEGPHSVYKNGQQIGTIQYSTPVFFWDKSNVEIWAITGMTTRYTPIEPTVEISFGIENAGPSEIVLGLDALERGAGGRAGEGK